MWDEAHGEVEWPRGGHIDDLERDVPGLAAPAHTFKQHGVRTRAVAPDSPAGQTLAAAAATALSLRGGAGRMVRHALGAVDFVHGMTARDGTTAHKAIGAYMYREDAHGIAVRMDDFTGVGLLWEKVHAAADRAATPGRYDEATYALLVRAEHETAAMAKVLAHESMHWLDRIGGRAAGFGMKASLHQRSPLAVRITAAGLVMNPVIEELYSVWHSQYKAADDSGGKGEVASAPAEGARAAAGAGSPVAGAAGRARAQAQGVAGEPDARAARRLAAQAVGEGGEGDGRKRHSAGRQNDDGDGRDSPGLIAGQSFGQAFAPLRALQARLARGQSLKGFVLPGHEMRCEKATAIVLGTIGMPEGDFDNGCISVRNGIPAS